MGLARPERVRTRIMMQKKGFSGNYGFLLVFRHLQQHVLYVNTVRFSQNGRKLLCLGGDIYVYDFFHQQNYRVCLTETVSDRFSYRCRFDTGCFAGASDEYVVSIVDDYFYIWELSLVDCHGENMIIFT